MVDQAARIKHHEMRLRSALKDGQKMADAAEAEGRSFTAEERKHIEALASMAGDAKRQIEDAKFAELATGGTDEGLLGAFKSAGWDPAAGKNKAAIAFDTFRAKTGSVESGDMDAFNRTTAIGAGLGADSCRLYPALPTTGVDAGTTSVETFSQKSRTLAAPADMQRAIDDVTNKPETSTVAEVEALPMKQVASVSTSNPNVLLQKPEFADYVNADLRLAFEDAIDDLVIDTLNASSVPTQAAGADSLASVRTAITTVQAAGYTPSLACLSPEVAEDLDLLQTSGPELHYLFATTARSTQVSPLWGLRVAIVKNLVNAWVLDASAIGRLYMSPVSLQSFEENAGRTNSTLVRLEAHSVFVTQRPAAGVEVLTGS